MTNPILPPSARFCRASLTPSLFDNDFAPHPTQHGTGSATEQPPRTVQIVTPSALLRDLLTRCLRRLDMTATDTSDAPDLVVLDLAAPDALAHCRTLREQHPDLPIVALTPLVTDHLLAWEAGANAVLPIPFDVSDLQATIRILLGDHDD